MWGYWICVALAFLALVLSIHVPSPLGQVFRVSSGVLLIAGGIHNGRVVAFKAATRGPYSTFGFDALLTQRQAGWSAIAVGVVLVATAAVGL